MYIQYINTNKYKIITNKYKINFVYLYIQNLYIYIYIYIYIHTYIYLNPLYQLGYWTLAKQKSELMLLSKKKKVLCMFVNRKAFNQLHPQIKSSIHMSLLHGTWYLLSFLSFQLTKVLVKVIFSGNITMQDAAEVKV